MTPKNEITQQSWKPLNREEYFTTHKEERQSLTYWADVWRRFRQNGLALFGVAVVIVLILTAIFGPLLTRSTYSDQNRDFTHIPPMLDLYKTHNDAYLYLSPTMLLYETTKRGKMISKLPETGGDILQKYRDFDLNGETIKLDFKQRPITLRDEKNREITIARNNVWNKTFWFGTDSIGRDLFVRVIYGARISLIIGFVASFVNLTIGVLYGGISAYAGGQVDNIMMRFVDILRSIPRLLYVILLMVIFGSGLKTVVITIGMVYWLGMARIVRGQILTIKNQEFVYAAQVMGAKTPRILLRHLIPNAMGPIIVTVAMNIPGAIFTEAFLSFVGLGVSAPQASWGTLCNLALSGLMTYPYQLFFPALAICITVLAFNFIGDGLRDSIDPRLRQ